jgi:hypothetical protein
MASRPTRRIGAIAFAGWRHEWKSVRPDRRDRLDISRGGRFGADRVEHGAAKHNDLRGERNNFAHDDSADDIEPLYVDGHRYDYGRRRNVDRHSAVKRSFALEERVSRLKGRQSA